MGDADGMVSGACHSTADTLRPCLQILKTKPGTKLVSAFFVMVVPDCDMGANGTFIFGDSGLEQNPDPEKLANIALSSAESFKLLTGEEPVVAMLSHSTKMCIRDSCIYVGSDDTHLLVDTGISKKRIEEGLKELDVKGEELDGILVTHEHSDHIQGLGVFSRKYAIPIYATPGTIQGIEKSSSLGKMPEGLLHPIETDKMLSLIHI